MFDRGVDCVGVGVLVASGLGVWATGVLGALASGCRGVFGVIAATFFFAHPAPIIDNVAIAMTASSRKFFMSI